MNFGGYANNEGSTWEGEEGFCSGLYTGDIITDGNTVDEVYIVHDKLGDGIGDVNSMGVWNLGLDDTLYYTEDIEFNGIQGGIDELGPFNYIETKVLPTMTIDAREPRSGPAGPNDLEAFSNYWLSTDCNPVEGADPNTFDVPAFLRKQGRQEIK